MSGKRIITEKMMVRLPEAYNRAWKRKFTDSQRSAGLHRAWQLAKRKPYFWTHFAQKITEDVPGKTTRLTIPADIAAYINENKSTLRVPVSHSVSALLYLAYTDLSNILYCKDIDSDYVLDLCENEISQTGAIEAA
ncbi:hypothetical protein [Thalassospira xiamenensis]|uniref:hypothetical protein n=1 Tax=Thalassospira xiamenensis TaxID=220697 RepID=UPI0011BF6333|nr:hypothetical protein [Thalassospira xiamenensis]